MRRTTTALVITLGLLVGACTGGDTLTTTTTLGDRPTVVPKALIAFDACEDLLSYVKRHALEMVGPWGLGHYGGGPWFFAEGGVEEFAPTGGGDDAGAPVADRQAGVDYSTTNVQEVGVDEPDIVKTDGNRILAVAQGRLWYVDVSGDDPKLLGSVSLEENGWSQELFLSGDTALLMARADVYALDVVADSRIAPSPGYNSMISVLTEIDISDPENMKVVRTLFVDGSYVSARMVGDVARVVISSWPTGLNFTYPQGGGLRGEQSAEDFNRQVIEESTVDNWIPYFILEEGNRTSEGRLFECTDASHPDEFAGLGTISVLTIDLSEGLTPGSAAAVYSDGDTVYASTENLYVATQRWVDWGRFENPEDAAKEKMTTQIHQFDISDPVRTRYLASGEVEGFLLNQWAMSEFEGVLRVASTSTPNWWGETDIEQESFVTTLGRQGDELRRLGRVDGLGKDEQIFAVRYIGDTGYVVTFRQTDPLYVIDLSDPANPRAVGELKILGYSAYLHPMEDGLLLGIGQDATEEGQRLGTQISVFDVSDPANPTRLHQYTLDQGKGEGGSSSAVEWDSRAFLQWAPTGLTVIPVSRWSWDGESEDWFSGAFAFTVDRETGITEVGTISQAGEPIKHTETYEEGQTETWYEWDWMAQINRSLVVGDRLYTMSEKGIMANDLETLEEEAMVVFEK